MGTVLVEESGEHRISGMFRLGPDTERASGAAGPPARCIFST
jgi:hypothetical protein